ncbi:MAG: hydrogenase maturation protease [Candidatus Omnitrophica bacterium]|nr:hydrogenase maturation protease [Candidatus Omnitrophota bacterium]
MKKLFNFKLKGKLAVLGMGNILCGDDGIGSLLAKRLIKRGFQNVYDGSISPENYLIKIIRENPKTIIIVDAIDFGGKPFEIKILRNNNFYENKFFLTHDSSLKFIIDFFINHKIKNILVLAIQPKKIGLGKTLSKELAFKLKILENEFIPLLKK